MHPSVHPSIHHLSSICPPSTMLLSIQPFTHLFRFHPPSSIRALSIQCVHLSIHPSTIHLSIHLPIQFSIHPSTTHHPSIHHPLFIHLPSATPVCWPCWVPGGQRGAGRPLSQGAAGGERSEESTGLRGLWEVYTEPPTPHSLFSLVRPAGQCWGHHPAEDCNLPGASAGSSAPSEGAHGPGMLSVGFDLWVGGQCFRSQQCL